MDGIETLTETRKLYKDLPIIMFSTLTERGGSKNLEALSFGAIDYVTKPANVGSISIAKQRNRDELIPKIKMFCAGKAVTKTPVAAIPMTVAKTEAPVTKKHFRPRAHQPENIYSCNWCLNWRLQCFSRIISYPSWGSSRTHSFGATYASFFTKLLAERLSSKSPADIQEEKAEE
jgi:CheY-like chemotaxis protein